MSHFLESKRLQELIDALLGQGYDVIGPTIQQNAVVLRSMTDASELPRGWTDNQQPAVYRIEETGSNRVFDFTIGPDSWKRFLFPPRATLANARLDDEGWHFDVPETPAPKYAFLGARACDIAAISVQDRVFISDEFVDPIYQRIRENCLIIAVQCAKTAATCFCSSMDSGPKCDHGFDLRLIELDSGFLVDEGSLKGEEIRDQLKMREANERELSESDEQLSSVNASLDKSFDADGVPELLKANFEHRHWDDVAQRCLSCTNCTMVCPTCFCSDVEEVSDLSQTQVERVRSWDSCFNPQMTYSGGGTARPTIRSRYRQWLTHKFATWHDQFETSGCIGCGRCITWCPVGIDLTAEVAAIREDAEKERNDE